MKLSALTLAALLCSGQSHAQQAGARDEFFWLGEINKATAVITTDGVDNQQPRPHPERPRRP